MAKQKFTSVTEQKQLNRRDAGISWKKWRPTSASGNETPCARTTARTAWDSDERECDPKKLP